MRTGQTTDEIQDEVAFLMKTLKYKSESSAQESARLEEAIESATALLSGLLKNISMIAFSLQQINERQQIL